MDKRKYVECVARIGVFGTFLGHGLLAYSINPKWIPLLTCYGFSESQAKLVMPIIGVVDFFVAAIVLLYPIRIVVVWAVFWAFMTALTRPISGDSWIEFVERSANWCLPLVLLYLQGFPRKVSDVFKIRS